MSTLTNDASPLRLIRSARPRAHVHQENLVRTEAPQHGLRAWPARRRLRLALRDLADDKHLLADIGLTREEALDEIAKPFWR